MRIFARPCAGRRRGDRRKEEAAAGPRSRHYGHFSVTGGEMGKEGGEGGLQGAGDGGVRSADGGNEDGARESGRAGGGHQEKW